MQDQIAFQRKIIREEYIDEKDRLQEDATHRADQVLPSGKYGSQKRVGQQMGRRLSKH